MGSRVQQRLPKNLCAGLVSIPSDGVFLQSSNAKYSDCPDCRHFENNILMFLTAFSAFPLNCGYLSDDIRCSKPHNFAKVANSADAN